jgi:hypothetical protein
MLALIAVGVLAVAVGVAWAVSSNGPYYAMPAWDQKLPASTRFVVLLDWNSEAVLDRNTGLVWERSPGDLNLDNQVNESDRTVWQAAINICADRRVGGQKGWRLPSFVELSSLVDPAANGPSLPAGHPFINVQSFSYWSATTRIGSFGLDPDNGWIVSFNNGGVQTTPKAATLHVWCVRGPMNAEAY